MTQFYTVVGANNLVKLSMVTTDPTYPVFEGERLLPDNQPKRTDYTTMQRVLRIEPIAADATEIPYTIINDDKAIAAKVAADLKASRQCTPLEFIERFTDAEQLAIVTLVMANPVIKLWYDKMLASRFVNFDDARTQKGMKALVDIGIIDAARSIAILPPYPV
jgi:hypothetical protein